VKHLEDAVMASIDFEIWLNHFEHHSAHARCVPREPAGRLTLGDRQHIASSIATFQLGEQSDGHGLREAARRFASACASPAVERIFELLIREEQRHAALLLDYMQEHRIPPKRTDWTDRSFRRLRRLAGLELYLQVLISAELTGIVYYRALEAATTCPRLKALCRILVCDELAHVGFESQLLLAMRGCRAAPQRTLLRWAHRAFFLGTASVVYSTHRALLRRAGYGARRFLRACLSGYAFYLDPVKASLANPLGQPSRGPA
jgi:rubrerythrin